MRISVFITLLLFSWQAFATPDIQHWQTKNGAQVYFVELKELPMVDIEIVFDAGGARDREDKNGVALLTNNLLSEAAGGMTADQISFEFERLGAQYGANVGYDSASVSLRSLSDNKLLQPALKNLKRVLSEPDFLADVLERQRNRMLISIQRKQQSPGSIAGDAFSAAIYGEHPYATPNIGFKETVEQITQEDIQKFYQQYYVAANATITIAGDVNRKRAVSIAEILSASLRKGKKPEPIPVVASLTESKFVEIAHPSAQTHILFGQPGMKFGDPDYFSLYVGNHILGGSGMTSVLFEEIREKRGLSYSTYSYFSPRREAGPFTAGLQTRADQAEQALTILRETIHKFIENGPEEEQLEAARKNITGGFPLRIASNSKILNYISAIGFYGLPLDYLDTYIEKIEAITVTDIKKAFQQNLNLDKFVTVKVGPASIGETDAESQ